MSWEQSCTVWYCLAVFGASLRLRVLRPGKPANYNLDDMPLTAGTTLEKGCWCLHWSKHNHSGTLQCRALCLSPDSISQDLNRQHCNAYVGVNLRARAPEAIYIAQSCLPYVLYALELTCTKCILTWVVHLLVTGTILLLLLVAG